jgi:hypothetical protein
MICKLGEVISFVRERRTPTKEEVDHFISTANMNPNLNGIDWGAIESVSEDNSLCYSSSFSRCTLDQVI